MIRVGIIDDHQILINGLVKIIDNNRSTKVVYQNTEAKDILDIDKLFNIDVLLLDIEMPEIDGIDLSKKILELDSNFKILILSMYNDKAIITNLKEIGVRGFLSKNTEETKLIEVIDQISNGGKYFEILKEQSSKSNNNGEANVFYQEKIKQLSDREKEVLTLIVKGDSNHVIGDKLFISNRTVDTHRSNIMKKLEVNNVASLVRVALKTKFIV
jgi:two-component system response regulator NreC